MSEILTKEAFYIYCLEMLQKPVGVSLGIEDLWQRIEVDRKAIVDGSNKDHSINWQSIYCPKHMNFQDMLVEKNHDDEMAHCTCGVHLIREWTFHHDDEDSGQ